MKVEIQIIAFFIGKKITAYAAKLIRCMLYLHFASRLTHPCQSANLSTFSDMI